MNVRRRAIIALLSAVGLVSGVAIVFTSDWYAWGRAEISIQSRYLPPSQNELVAFTAQDVNLVAVNELQAAASQTILISGKTRLTKLNYRWRKMPKNGKLAKLPLDIPLLAMRIQLCRRSSDGEVCVAKKHLTIYEHKNRMIDWQLKIEAPSRSGTYRLYLDEVEYNEVFQYSKPLAEFAVASKILVVDDLTRVK